MSDDIILSRLRKAPVKECNQSYRTGIKALSSKKKNWNGPPHINFQLTVKADLCLMKWWTFLPGEIVLCL